MTATATELELIERLNAEPGLTEAEGRRFLGLGNEVDVVRTPAPVAAPHSMPTVAAANASDR